MSVPTVREPRALRALALVVATLAALAGCRRNNGVPGVAEVSATPPAGAAAALRYNAKAQRWTWTFRSEHLGEARELVVPVGQLVEIDLRSIDVPHRMTVPGLGIDAEADGAHPSSLWLRVLRAGTYPGVCREECRRAPGFRPTIRALPPAEFDAARAAAQQPPPGQTVAQWGERLFRDNGCSACHSMDGAALAGPTLRGIWSTELRLTDGRTVRLEGEEGARFVRDSLVGTPRPSVVGYPRIMPTYAGMLRDVEVAALTAYIACGAADGCAQPACAGLQMCAPPR